MAFFSMSQSTLNVDLPSSHTSVTASALTPAISTMSSKGMPVISAFAMNASPTPLAEQFIFMMRVSS